MRVDIPLQTWHLQASRFLWDPLACGRKEKVCPLLVAAYTTVSKGAGILFHFPREFKRYPVSCHAYNHYWISYWIFCCGRLFSQYQHNVNFYRISLLSQFLNCTAAAKVNLVKVFLCKPMHLCKQSQEDSK